MYVCICVCACVYAHSCYMKRVHLKNVDMAFGDETQDLVTRRAGIKQYKSARRLILAQTRVEFGRKTLDFSAHDAMRRIALNSASRCTGE